MAVSSETTGDVNYFSTAGRLRQAKGASQPFFHLVEINRLPLRNRSTIFVAKAANGGFHVSAARVMWEADLGDIGEEFTEG